MNGFSSYLTLFNLESTVLLSFSFFFSDITLYINRLNARIASMRTTIEKKEANRMKARAATLAALEKISPDHPAVSSLPAKSQVIEALHWDEDKVQK